MIYEVPPCRIFLWNYRAVFLGMSARAVLSRFGQVLSSADWANSFGRPSGLVIIRPCWRVSRSGVFRGLPPGISCRQSMFGMRLLGFLLKAATG